MKTHTTIESPIGDLTLVNEDGVLCGLYMQEHARRPEAVTFGEHLPAATKPTGFGRAIEELSEYFAGERRRFTVPVAPVGSVFDKTVWKLLEKIPFGETRSYLQLAQEFGDSAAARAVGSANGRNPISIIVPCHRVIASNGSLTGYAGGLERKRFLLDLENPLPMPASQSVLF